MIEFIMVVLTVSLFLYAFLAGADFGAGIIEILPSSISREEKTKFIGRAMGPVWEANHIWLILALVITFSAFPKIFWFISEWFHFPLGALVMGIIFRGASFTFLHYDPIIDGSQKVYRWIFGLSSIWCTLWLGIIIGSLMLGDFSLNDTDIFTRYFKHWLNPFSFSMGIFTTLLMMFNASLFLLAEANENRTKWRNQTIKIFAVLFLSGMVVHGIFIGISPERWRIFFANPIGIGLIILSFVLLFPLYFSIENNFRNTSRVIAGAQLICIMCAGFVPLFPKIILFRDLSSIHFYDAAAEPAVLKAITIALIFGSILILPGYYFLIRIFKSKEEINS
jgi:cytochrome d ubiquinol oxidase subunit II